MITVNLAESQKRSYMPLGKYPSIAKMVKMMTQLMLPLLRSMMDHRLAYSPKAAYQSAAS
nr:hypothetical protein [uncultured bacterium]